MKFSTRKCVGVQEYVEYGNGVTPTIYLSCILSKDMRIKNHVKNDVTGYKFSSLVLCVERETRLGVVRSL